MSNQYCLVSIVAAVLVAGCGTEDLILECTQPADSMVVAQELKQCIQFDEEDQHKCVLEIQVRLVENPVTGKSEPSFTLPGQVASQWLLTVLEGFASPIHTRR